EELKARVRALNVDTGDNLADLPNTLTEIEAEIEFIMARLSALQPDGKVKENKMAKEAQLDALEQSIAALHAKKDAIAARHQQNKEAAVTEIEAYLEPISNAFSEMFGRFGFEGKLNLNTEGEKWALQIMVRFRDGEPLAPLSPHRQSGGERSLTTVLFLLAL